MPNYCAGCRDDFYNGNNNLGVAECWCKKNAKVVKKKFVPLSLVPPWNMKPETTFDCHHRQGYVAVDPHITR